MRKSKLNVNMQPLSIFLIVIGTAVCSGKYIDTNNNDFETLQRRIDEYSETGTRPADFYDVLKQFQFSSYPFRDESNAKTLKGSTLCPLCKGTLGLLINLRRLGFPISNIAKQAVGICETLKIETSRVCQGAISTYQNLFAYLVDESHVTAKKLCGATLPACLDESDFEWSIEVPAGQSIEKPKATNDDSFNVLQISDFHFDPNYREGKTTDCGEPVCCQYDQPDGDPSNGTACGPWTEYYDADTPERTVDNVLSQTQNHNFSYVYFTGDIVSHRIWSTNVKDNTAAIRKIINKIKKQYDVPVFPILGNHEPTPINIWTSNVTDSKLSTQWLFDLVAELWSDWLGEEAKETLLKGGYYTVTPRQGFRIIALNSNVAYVLNWGLLITDVDPYGQLEWLVKTLEKAEANQESVHILSHVPSGTEETFYTWNREYNKIVNRFANTITGQFNGHTHKDDFVIHYNSSNPSQAINVAWNGASITTYTKANPSYKLYKVHSETYDVLDQEEYTFNLEEANNSTGTPNWYQLYSFRDAYGVTDLSPKEIDNLVQRMTKETSLLDKYHNFRYRNSTVRGECDESCQMNYLCIMTTSLYRDQTKCEQMKKLYSDNTK